MKIKFYLIVKRNGSVRTTKNQPGIEWDEIFMECNLNIGDKLFQRPMLTANIEISDAQMPVNLDVSVVGEIENVIQERTGYEVQLHIVEPNKEA